MCCSGIDICQDLAKDDEVFFRHYPQLKLRTDPVIEHDRTLFDELTTLLSSDGVIGFVDRTNMAGFLFRDAELDSLWAFQRRCNTPEREFITPALEAARRARWAKVNTYLYVIAHDTFPANTPGWRSVPPEWEEEQPERFERAVDALHTLAGEIVALHRDLVRVGRAHLIGIRS